MRRWPEETTPLPGPVLVLMYHGIHADRDSRGRFDPRYSVHPERFIEQLAYLRDRNRVGWLPVAGEPLVAPPRGHDDEVVLITFDDGDASLAETALPALAGFGLGAVFFVTCGLVGQHGMIRRSALRRLVDAGMVIGSHAVSHRFLNTLSSTGLESELAHSREFLEQATGREVRLLSLPGGRGGARELKAAARAGYRSVFGSVPGNNRSTPAGGLIQRVAITRDVTLEQFRQIVRWRGPATWRIRARHAALRWPKRLIGDRGYDWVRSAWVRSS